MKTSLILAALLLGSTVTSLAQQLYVGSKPLQDIQSNYCMLYAFKKPFLRGRFSLALDYGQGFWPIEYSRLTDSNSELIRFESLAAAFNTMKQLGWEYVDSIRIYEVRLEDYYYLFKRTQIHTDYNGS